MGTSRKELEKLISKEHIWIQARNDERGILLAGGVVVPGVKAFLVGYRSKDLDIDFKPPLAMQLFGLSTFMSTRADWSRRLSLSDVCSSTRRLVVRSQAPLKPSSRLVRHSLMDTGTMH